MSNLLGAYYSETKKDIFFPEDDEMFAFFGKYKEEMFNESHVL